MQSATPNYYMIVMTQLQFASDMHIDVLYE